MDQDEDELAMRSPDEPPRRVKLSPDLSPGPTAPSTSTAPPASAVPVPTSAQSRPDLRHVAAPSLARFGRGPYSSHDLNECAVELAAQGYPPGNIASELWRAHATAQAYESAAASTSATPTAAQPQPSPAASTSSRPSDPGARSSYLPWTRHDNERLMDMRRDNLRFKDVAERIGRTAAACMAQYHKLCERDTTLPRAKRGRPRSTAPLPTTFASPARSTPAAASPSARPSVKPEPRLLDVHSPLATSTSRLATDAAAAPARTRSSSSTPQIAPAPPSSNASARPPRTRPLRRRIGLALTGPAHERALAALRRLREPVDLDLDAELLLGEFAAFGARLDQSLEECEAARAAMVKRNEEDARRRARRGPSAVTSRVERDEGDSRRLGS